MKNSNKKLISLFLGMMLIVAMALFTTGCGKDEITDENIPTPGLVSPGVYEDLSNIGEGSKKFDLIIMDIDGNETLLTISTDQETVGAALQEHGIISGEAGEFGMYIKTVNGITADYDVDQTYWAFYIEGEYASSGVDTTKVESGITYSLEVTK